MAQLVSDVLTPDPTTIGADRTVREAADLMRTDGIGALVVTEGGRCVGLVTDRDLVVRVLATGGGPADPVRAACSTDLVTVTPDDSVDDAARLMAQYSVRRLPVVDGDLAVGIVSLGDLAIDRDPTSVLGGISAEVPNT